jgi:hypothetical protein
MNSERTISPCKLAKGDDALAKMLTFDFYFPYICTSLKLVCLVRMSVTSEST